MPAAPSRSPPHGVADWPFGPAARDPLPDCLPGGRPWPRLRVIVRPGEGDAAETHASIAAQAYPARVVDGRDGDAAEDDKADFLLILRAGDLLAPGALAALGVEAALTGADAVAGLRVLFDEAGVIALDALGAREGRLDPTEARAADVTGGEILLSRAAIARAGGLDLSMPRPVGDLWPRLAQSGARLARCGRPVLLQRADRARIRPSARSLAIASLTDLGHRGGAGIAQRRLAEALALSGHSLVHLRLADESPPEAAEWTCTFPRTEAAATAVDLVLAGNLHGATRSTAILGRLALTRPVALVTHDLFAMTGRCAHPKDCTRIATGCDALCPSPDRYPQLAPKRIAAVHAEKRAVLAGPASPLLLVNSAWAEERARALAPAGTRIAPIRLAFPAGVFRPGDRAALRRRLGLPEHDLLVVFAAVIADAPDKGFSDLVATLRAVARPGVGFVALGRLDAAGALGLSGLHAPGPIDDEARLAQWYAACDIHLTASRLETFGQTPVEAGLCGLPTVAYRASGLTSAVLDGVTGLLAEPRPDALAQALDALIADGGLRTRLGATARIVCESRFSHAASALSLHDALGRHGLLPDPSTQPRLLFSPALLGRFAFAADRHPGEAGTVAAPMRPLARGLVRALRRAKHALVGRGMPLPVRRALYAAALLRRAAARRRTPQESRH